MIDSVDLNKFLEINVYTTENGCIVDIVKKPPGAHTSAESKQYVATDLDGVRQIWVDVVIPAINSNINESCETNPTLMGNEEAVTVICNDDIESHED
jgi:hypothetical protein